MENINVLIVESDQQERKRILGIINSLNHYSYTIYEAENLGAAIETASRIDQFILLMNLNLSDSQGIESFVEFQKQFPSSIKIILSEKGSNIVSSEIGETGPIYSIAKSTLNTYHLYNIIQNSYPKKIIYEEIRDLEKLGSHAFDSINSAVCILDISGRILSVNAKWKKTAGISNESLIIGKIGENYFKFFEKIKIDAISKVELLQKIDGVAKGRRENDFFEHSLSGKSNKTKFGISITPVKLPNEKYILLNFLEIEEDNVNLISTPLENYCTNLLSISNFNGYITKINKSWTKILGYSQEEIMSKPWIDFVYSKDKTKVSASVEKLKSDQIQLSFTARFVCKDKSVKWLSWDSTSYPDKKLIISSITDNTEKKRKELRLKTIDKAIEQSPISIVVTDVEGNIEYVNPKFSELSGYSFAEVRGKNPRILKSNLKTETDYAELWNTISSGKVWKGEFLNKKKNGEGFWEDAKIFPIFNDDGAISQFVGIKEDITAKKKVEAELLRAKKEAEKVDRLKAEFLAQISHEIRTPINTLLSFSSLIESDLGNSISKDISESFKYINTSGKRIIRTIELLIKLSELYSETYEPEYDDHNIDALLKDIIASYQPLAANKNLKLTYFNTYGDNYLNFDMTSMTEILNNLIDNAIKFTHTGEVKVVVSSTLIGRLSITVSDTGEGISQKYIKNLYTPFSQESGGYSRKYDGNGLGLTLVKEYCRINNASIFVSSEKGVGTSFTITMR